MAIINQYVVALTCLMTKFIPNSSMGKKQNQELGTNKQKNFNLLCEENHTCKDGITNLNGMGQTFRLIMILNTH